MEILVLLLCIVGIWFFMSQADGPFNLSLKVRNSLFQLPYLGVHFYRLFLCPFCLGMHAGWITYLIYMPTNMWLVNEVVIWSFAGGTVSLLASHYLSQPSTIVTTTIEDKEK